MLRIKQLREERGWSQRALAQKIGANPKTVNFWERGTSEPTSGFIVALADIFECSADYVLGREDDFGAVSIQNNLSGEEQALLACYNRISAADKAALKAFGDFLLSRN